MASPVAPMLCESGLYNSPPMQFTFPDVICRLPRKCFRVGSFLQAGSEKVKGRRGLAHSRSHWGTLSRKGAMAMVMTLFLQLGVAFSQDVSMDSLPSSTQVLADLGGDIPCPDSLEGRQVMDLGWEGLRSTSRTMVTRQLRHRQGTLFSCRDWRLERNRLADLDVFSEIRLHVVEREVHAGANIGGSIGGSTGADVGKDSDANLGADMGAGRSADSDADVDANIGADVRLDRVVGEANLAADMDETAGKLNSSQRGVSLVYQVRELPPYLPYVTVAKTDRDGFSAGPGLAALNLFGTGAHMEAAARFGGTTEAYASITGLEVGTLPLEYDALVSHVDSWNSYQGFHENSWRLKADFKHPFAGLSSPWLGVYGFEFFSLESDKSGITVSESGDRLPRLALGLAYDARNRKHLPDSGFYVEARLQQTGGTLNELASDFFDAAFENREYLLDMRWYWPYAKRHVLAIFGLYRFREGLVPSYDLYRAGGANSLRGFDRGSRIGRSEAIATVEERFSLLKQRSLRVWKWGIPLSVQAIAGVEILRSWNHSDLMEGNGPASIYCGIHVLTAGLDRLRFEGGSAWDALAPNADIGFFDKADAQRFHTR